MCDYIYIQFLHMFLMCLIFYVQQMPFWNDDDYDDDDDNDYTGFWMTLI